MREAEALVRYFEEELEKKARQVQKTREEIAFLKTLTGCEIQAREKHVFSLNFKARQIAQDLEKARQMLESAAWNGARP